MKGCIRRLGCLVLIIALVALWYWYAKVERPATTTTTTSAVTGASNTNTGWQPLSQTDADRGRVAVEALARRSGPVFANLTPAEAASYIFLVVAKQLPPSARNVEASIVGDRLYVRSEVDLKDFGGSGQLGGLGMLLGSRDSVLLGGTIHMLRPGLAEFQVQEVKLGKLEVPKALIPRLITQMTRGKNKVPGVSESSLPMAMPAYISDVRIANGKITLYKSVK
ncbi:MAG TPA: hypothetical protein VHT23_03220 [Gemmatimonadaceae bacterium]|jgi:hypothetical protein|nr:hypothetical protein [Gemmatimonadaceae bacterium]